MHIRKKLKQWLPKYEVIVQNKSLRVFGKLLYDPNIWHLTRHSIARALAVGLFCAWIPVPFQMIIAAGGAIMFHANIAFSVALVWITNPVTMPILFYVAYRSGTFLLQTKLEPFEFELSLSWLVDTIQGVGGPFLFGCLILGIISSASGYLLCHFIWKRSIKKNWRNRSKRKRNHVKESS